MKSIRQIFDKYGIGAFLMVLLALFVAKHFFDYLGGKGVVGYEGNSKMQDHNRVLSTGAVKPSDPDGDEKFATVGNTDMVLPKTEGDGNNPGELLPHDDNSQWADLNPSGKGELSNINFLDAGYHMGNLSAPMKNTNLSIRAEPPNPQMDVGPWNKSTIEPDPNRIGFELS